MSNDLDDLMDLLDLGKPVKPQDPNEKFITYLTFGVNPRINLLYSFLHYQMAVFDFLEKNNVKMVRDTSLNGSPYKRNVERLEYGAVIIEAYLYGNHNSRFDARFTEGPCDPRTIVQTLLAIPEVKAIICKKPR